MLRLCVALESGLLTGKYRRGESGRADTFKQVIRDGTDNARKSATVDTILEIAAARAVSPARVSIAWAASRGLVPILRPRTVAHLTDKLGAAGLGLAAADTGRLDAVSVVSLGFPHEVMAEDVQRIKLAGGIPDQIETPVVPVA